jgi:nitric oxide reductase NorD protein
MELDQLLFSYFYRKYKLIKKKLIKKNIYYEINLENKERFIKDFFYIHSNLQVEIKFTFSELEFNFKALSIPSKLELLLTETNSFYFLLFCLLKLSNQMYEKEFSYINTIKFIKKYPAFKENFKTILKELRKIKKNDSNHYLKVKSYLSFKINPTTSINLQGIDNFLPRQNKTLDLKEKKIDLNISESELLELEQKKIQEYTLGHNFEKIETLEEFKGNWRDIDNEEESEEQKEALSELKLNQYIRAENPAHSTFTTETGLGINLEIKEKEPKLEFYKYDEWNYKTRTYQKEYCSVEELIQVKEDNQYTQKVLDKNKSTLFDLEKKLILLYNQKYIKKRLTQGDDIDIDAIVERYSDLIAKQTPSEKVYTLNKIRESDLYFHFLIDSSLSTDSWVHGQRILDVEKTAILLFCECLEKLKIQFSVSSFFSRTRNHCKYIVIKNKEDSWNTKKHRLSSIEPNGYTRIGPALRHSKHRLENIKARQKWILLFTDARPNDYDRYEGEYGVQDVHFAIRELKREGFHIHTIAIGKEEKASIPRMMKEASYEMLLYPENLLFSLTKLFKKIESL